MQGENDRGGLMQILFNSYFDKIFNDIGIHLADSPSSLNSVDPKSTCSWIRNKLIL